MSRAAVFSDAPRAPACDAREPAPAPALDLDALERSARDDVALARLRPGGRCNEAIAARAHQVLALIAEVRALRARVGDLERALCELAACGDDARDAPRADGSRA